MKKFQNTFVGLPLNPNYHEQFVQILNSINNIIPEIRTVNPKTPHITVYYLGRQSIENVRDINHIVNIEKDILLNAKVQLHGFDYFTHKEPKVIFLNIIPNIALQNFYMKLSDKLKHFNTPDARAYRPHLTIARLVNPESKKYFSDKFHAIDNLLKNVRWEFEIDKINIYGRDFDNEDKSQQKLFEIDVNK